jgi:eukaryotic-like serine/threonine-protein kinase
VFQSITKRSLFFNLVMAGLLAFGAFFIFFQLLGWITQHGKYVTVPDVKGKSFEEARQLLEAQGFEVEVQDSVYIDTLQKLSIIKQAPLPNELVKVNRTIYLTINRMQAPLVTVPNFVGQTFRSVEMQLRTLGFKLGDTTFKPDFAVGSVLEQSINGIALKPGTPIPMGSKIDLVLGGGVQANEMNVPVLLGLTFQEAKTLLEVNGLIIGAVVVDGAVGDSLNAFIIKQNPPIRNDEGAPIRIRGGQLMDVWISMDKTKIDSAQLKSVPKTSTPTTTTENEY